MRAVAPATSADKEPAHPSSRADEERRRWWSWAGWPWVASVLSGLLLVLSFPPWDQGWLAWLALMPLAAAAWWPLAPQPRQGWWARSRPFRLGYLAGFIFFAGSFYWIGTLGVLYAAPGLYLLPVLLAAYMGAYFGFWVWFLQWLSPVRAGQFRSSPGNLLLGAAAASAWVAGEWVRSWLFSGFSWNMLGVAMRWDIAMIQIASVTGVAGLSWLAAFANVMGVVIIRRLVSEIGPDFLKRVRWEFSATMALIAFIFGWGVRTLFAGPGSTLTLQVAVVQPNISQELKHHGVEDTQEEANQRIDAMHESLRRNHLLAASTGASLIVWPESATPEDWAMERAGVEAFVQQGSATLLFGALEEAPDPQQADAHGYYNSAILVSPAGEPAQIYRKQRLVIFGEYMPFRAWLPSFLTRLVPGDLLRGHEPTLLRTVVPLGALVCFEDTAADVVRGLVQNGAQALVNITNDGWFLRSAGPEQHLANAVLRSVEFRRPLLRATNTGVSCLIDPFGRVQLLENVAKPGQRLQPHEEGAGTATLAIPLEAPLTFYARHGEWWSHLCTAVTGSMLVLGTWRRRRTSATAEGASS